MPAFVLRTTRPLRRPLEIGEKSIAIAHVPEAVTGFEIEQVVLGSSAKSPLVVTPVMFSELVPVLVKVTDFAAAVVPTTVLPKVRLEGFNDTPGAVPVPLSVTVCVPPLALSVMVTTPVRVPLAVGVNVTAIVHVPEAAIGVEIEQVVPAPRAKSPLAARADDGKRTRARIGQGHRLRRRCRSYHSTAEGQARRIQQHSRRRAVASQRDDLHAATCIVANGHNARACAAGCRSERNRNRASVTRRDRR